MQKLLLHNSTPVMSLWLPTLSLLLLLSLSMHLLSYRAAAVGPVSVESPVRVSRGGRVDLRKVLDFRPEFLPPASDCKVTNLAKPGIDCGRVSPNIFDCRKYSGTILYQHLGCFTALELATFMLTALPHNYSSAAASGAASSSSFSSLQPVPVHASVFSVEVHVEDPHPVFKTLKVEAVQADVSSNRSGGVLNLTIVFPPPMVGRCHYEVLSGWRDLQLPMSGQLRGAVNQPLPSGYIPMSSLTYHPYHPESYDQTHTDYILIKIYVHRIPGHSLLHAYGVFGFRTSGSTANASSSFISTTEVVKLEREFLVVRQAANIPVSASDFASFNLTQSLATFRGASAPSVGQQDPLLRYTFPVLDTGSFQSVHSTSTNVSFSVFSTKELQDGQVSFHPTDSLSSTNPIIYPYNVTTVTGVLIAKGEVTVLATERDWVYPSQRRNLPLEVSEGGWGPINEATLHFYVLKPCDTLASMRAIRPPSHGHLVYRNGSHVRNAEVLLLAVGNTTLLRYIHSGGEAFSDVIYWEVLCPTGPALQVVMSVLVAAVDDSHPALHIGSEVHVYRDWPIPISPSFFQLTDLDSSLDNIYFRVTQIQGSLLRTDEDITQSHPHHFLPFVSTSNLRRYSQEKVCVFRLQDLNHLRIWYVPGNVTVGEVIELTVNDSINQGPEIYSLYMVLAAQQPNQSLVVSTTEQYPYILRKKLLPLHHQGHMYLTPYFLFSQAPPVSSVNVKYIVQTPPRHGYLCAVTHDLCSPSLQSFTQQDISHRHVIYRPNNETLLVSDYFTFDLTVQGFFHTDNTVHVFNFTASPLETVVSNTPLVLDTAGRARQLTTQHFSIFSSLLQTTNLTFIILEPPRFGSLILMHHSINQGGAQSLGKQSSFSYDDLIGNLLYYNSSQHRSLGLCTDQVRFEAFSPNGMLHGRLPIAFKDGEKSLSVTTQPHRLIGLSRFSLTSNHISASSSFCAEWVIFFVRTTPRIGHLSMKDHTHKTEHELRVGSSFTAKDLQSGLVCYSLSSSSQPISVNSSDSFTFTSVDPSSPAWPMPPTIVGGDNSDRGGVGSGGISEGSDALFSKFTVLMEPPLSKEDYILELNLSSRHPLTWLPNHQAYGYTLLPSDITHLNTTLPLQGVLLQLEKTPNWGNMVLNQTLVSSFTVADILSGQVAYLKNKVVRNGWFRERVELGLYAYLPNLLWLADVHHFVLEWAVVDFDRSIIAISESQGLVQLTVRYVTLNGWAFYAALNGNYDNIPLGCMIRYLVLITQGT